MFIFLIHSCFPPFKCACFYIANPIKQQIAEIFPFENVDFFFKGIRHLEVLGIC